MVGGLCQLAGVLRARLLNGLSAGLGIFKFSRLRSLNSKFLRA